MFCCCRVDTVISNKAPLSPSESGLFRGLGPTAPEPPAGLWSIRWGLMRSLGWTFTGCF